MAAQSTIDPMHQFQIDALAGDLAGNPFAFTNSALWMMIVLGSILVFRKVSSAGMKRIDLSGRSRGFTFGGVNGVSSGSSISSQHW